MSPVAASIQCPCFHLSIPALDLERSGSWYERVLGCRPGRSSPQARILAFGGHQLVLQLCSDPSELPQSGIYPRHFGLVFESLEQWQSLRDRLEGLGEPFAVAPRCRFAGQELEHMTFFLRDPAGNWLEFKHYRQAEAVLGSHHIAEVGDRELR